MKRPFSKKGYYSCWIIMKNSTEGSIKSAYCTFKGGIDGCCRHVVATLFEVPDFIEDFKNTSCTSGPCLWVRRASKADQIGKVVSAIEIDTSVTVNSNRGAPVPVYSPLPMDFPHPEPNVFFDRLKELQPNACALRAIFDCSSCTEPTQSLSCATPIEKAQQFVQEHTCIADSCKCSNIFVYYNLMYSPLECDEIEKSTRGQANNDNWHKMRKGLLTASNFHKIIHSTNLEKTAQSLLCGNSFNHTYVPDPISFGRRFEEKARDMYIKAHRFKHKLGNIKVNIPGLVISKDDPILACSPDGIVHCKECGTFLIEIKCLFKYKHFHPKNALKMSSICIENEDKILKLNNSHMYYDQIQGQMGVTGIDKCILVAYTHKGIHCIPVEFDSIFWETAKSVYHKFYHEAYFHVMLQSLHPKMSQ